MGHDELAREVLERVRRALPPGESFSLHEPTFEGREREFLARCIDTGWVSTAGRYVDEFEARLSELTGAAYAVATVNGTAALHVCLRLAGVGPGDEVIVPALSFVATANAVAYCGAVPHFADASEETLGLDPQRLAAHLAIAAGRRGGELVNLATGRTLRAVVPMHTFGHPADLDALAAACREFGLPLIEDAAESLGSLYRGAHTGTRGLLGALSFNGNKIVTTGGGGAVLTGSRELAAAARHLTTTARTAAGWEFVHDEVGYNYRMPNVNAALGLAQLERLPQLVERKRALAARYRGAFEGCAAARVFEPPGYSESNHWLTAVLLETDDMAARDAVLKALNDAGIGARPAWRLMHRLPMYRECPRMELSVAERLERKIVNLPSSAHLAP
ncbi:MAG: LegC family aminotransferase [Burkholderiales bacterium]|nr:LegC family aminotransferase [Burkholderiales bacterium]